MTPKKVCSGSKIIIFEKWPQVTLLYEFDVKNCWNFQNMQNIAVFRKVANMSTFCISAQYVRVSLREPEMYKSSRKWLCWVHLDANQKFYSKKLFRTPTKFSYVFWEMTPGYPTWCRVGRVVLSRNDKLLLGEKSPSTYLGIIERGNGHNWIWAKLPLVELSQETAPGDHLQLIFVETNTIVFGRNYLGSSCLRYRW